MISCPLCKKVFKSPCNLRDHMVTHTKEKPHKCHICSGAFGTLSQRSKHIKSVHDGIKPTQNKNSQCPLCSYKCYNKTLLRNHLRTHSGERPFSCSKPGCRFKAKQESNLKKHVRVVHTHERPYECLSDGCNYKAKCSASFRSHLKTHCNERPFACQFLGCNLTFKFKNKLARHTSTVHSGEKPFKCSTCDYRAKSKSHLKGHMQTHDEVKRFRCQAPSCGYATRSKHYLEVHFDRKHGQKNVLCTARGCNFRCGAIAALKEHLKYYNENPILKCPRDSCIFRTRHKRFLLSHISLRHEGSTSGSVEILQCQYPSCSYATQSPISYKHHRISHNAEENRKHVCMLCFCRFTEFRLLENHIKRHNGEKPYRCSHCNYASTSSKALKLHAKRHHQIYVIPHGKEDQVRKCFTCSMIFWSYSELVLHSMSHLQPVVVLEKLKLEIV